MLSITHVPFGILTAEFFCSTFDMEMDAPAIAIAAVCSLLPDIDHPGSIVGFLLQPTGLPQFLERRPGHRTITHSWIFILAACVILAPLWLSWGALYYLSALLGIISHIVLDMVNVSGVPLFWPNRRRWVLPAVEDYRINVGSRAEIILAIILVVVTTGFTPISMAGFRSSFYYITKDAESAAREARKFFPDYNLTCKIHGTWRDTLLPVHIDEVFRVVAAGQTTLYYARGQSVFTTGMPSPSATIDQILVERASPVIRESKSVNVDYQVVDEIADQIPDSAIITGSLIVTALDDEQRKEDYIEVSEEFPTIKIIPRGPGSMEIIITYCPAERFRKALCERGIFVMQGTLTVTSEKIAEEKIAKDKNK